MSKDTFPNGAVQFIITSNRNVSNNFYGSNINFMHNVTVDKVTVRTEMSQ